MNTQERRALKPDAQPFDAITITTVPRYKTSGLSGDEWRISARIDFYRKGEKVHEAHYRDVEKACAFLLAEFYRAIDDGKGYYAGEGDTCDQEGCADKATVTYRVKAAFCQDHPHEHRKELRDEVVVRKFCARHSKRGDAAFDDADSNYEVLDGIVRAPLVGDVRKSSPVAVEVKSIDEIQDAIRKVRDELKNTD